MMQDPAYRPNILEPLEIIGVDAFGEGQMMLKARIKTAPLKQWEVGRELRRRIAKEFKARGIEIAVARTVMIRGSEGSGSTTGSEGQVHKNKTS